MKKILLFLALLLPSAVFAGPDTIFSSVCFSDPQGNCYANGMITFNLNVQAKAIAGGQIAPMQVFVTLDSTGKVPANTVLYGNDQLQPTGTFYRVTIFNSNGLLVSGKSALIWVISGASPVDLSLIVASSGSPDPGLANPVLQNPAAPQTITGQPLTLAASAPLTVNSQTTSTVSTGTAPFSIASTTVVPNLNAGLLNGATFAAPGAIGGTTPGSGAFTTVSASGQITSTLATGTAPFSISSTTVTPNLNAQLHNGLTAPASAIVGISDSQTLTNKTLTAPAVTGGTIDGFSFSHTALQISAATNYGTALGTQTVVSSLPTTGPVSVYFLIVVATAGVGCGAGTNSVTVNPLTWTAPGGTVENINPSSNMGISANGVLDQGASSFGSTAFTNNGIQAIVAKSGTAITYVTTSSLGSAGCSTVPQYQVYARAFF